MRLLVLRLGREPTKRNPREKAAARIGSGSRASAKPASVARFRDPVKRPGAGRPIFDTADQFLGYQGIGRDLTNEYRARQLLQLEQAVNTELTDAININAALRASIRAICTAENLEAGVYWQRSVPSSEPVTRSKSRVGIEITVRPITSRKLPLQSELKSIRDVS